MAFRSTKLAVAAYATERFPSLLCLAELENVDGLGEFPGATRAAAGLAEDSPCFKLRVCVPAGCAEFRVDAVCLLLGFGL